MQHVDFRTLPARPEFAPIVNRVESLGISCDLGFVQRKCKSEPLGLLRFAYSPLEGLIHALNADFADLTNPEHLYFKQAQEQDWRAYHRHYQFEFHTGKLGPKVDQDELRQAMTGHLDFMAPILMENLAVAEKIFVYRPQMPGPAGAAARRLRDAMHRFGRPVLLWLDCTDDPARLGTAEWTEPGSLMTAYIDRFSARALHVSVDSWLRAIAAAVQLWDATAG